jgi:hypothetical protein
LLLAVIAVGHLLGFPRRLAARRQLGRRAAVRRRAAPTDRARDRVRDGRRHTASLIQPIPGASMLLLGYPDAVAGLVAVLYVLAVTSPAGGSRRACWRASCPVWRGPRHLLVAPGVVEALRRRDLLLALAPLLGKRLYLGLGWSGGGPDDGRTWCRRPTICVGWFCQPTLGQSDADVVGWLPVQLVLALLGCAAVALARAGVSFQSRMSCGRSRSSPSASQPGACTRDPAIWRLSFHCGWPWR